MAHWRGYPPGGGDKEDRANHGVQGDKLRQASTLAWLVHDPLQTLAFRPPNGRADQALRDQGTAEAGEAFRSRVRPPG
jgi:hypothetical protein